MKIRNLAVAAIAASVASPGFAGAQFPDVSPTDWAYPALQNLVQRYGCVAGYSDGTLRGKNSATRYESIALMSACLDEVYNTLSNEDRVLADRVRIALATESARITRLENAAATRAVGVGSYLGVGVTLNRQGVNGGGYDANRTVAGATVQSRLPLGKAFGANVSVRPYVNFSAGPDSQIGSAGGVLGTVDVSLAGRKIGDAYVSSTNLYLGAGGQWALTNNGLANFQTSIGQGSQFLFVAGVERSLTPSLVGFADLKFPTQSNGVSGTGYSPVGNIGLGFKF